MHYPGERGHCHQGMMSPWWGVLGKCCVSWMNVGTYGFPSEYCSEHHTASGGLLSFHSTYILVPFLLWVNDAHNLLFFHCTVTQFWLVKCRHFWRWTSVNMDPLTDVELKAPYAANCGALWVHVATIKVLSVLCYSRSAVGLEYTGPVTRLPIVLS